MYPIGVSYTTHSLNPNLCGLTVAHLFFSLTWAKAFLCGEEESLQNHIYLDYVDPHYLDLRYAPPASDNTSVVRESNQNQAQETSLDTLITATTSEDNNSFRTQEGSFPDPYPPSNTIFTSSFEENNSFQTQVTSTQQQQDPFAHAEGPLPPPDPPQLRVPIATHVDPLQCHFECCMQKFRHKKDLDRHRRTEHESEDRFYCPHSWCKYSIGGSKNFKRRDKLKDHMRTHNKGN
ncbi:hypothetical protein HYALB_00005427 [Hymenoscyphus albidus]|uniref:C2H2-type domain-containing protein n=1 Tax=Hymenoscyphus albidus TaxID=595503 RepID=A0A9N9LFB1_9HELO|nr:hypothetical protein HYALB_00005427 [Hymenoscyphus albidus]